MKPRLTFSNGYWSWAYEGVHKTGYTCITCAGRDATALAKGRNSERFERRLMEIHAQWSFRDWSSSSPELIDISTEEDAVKHGLTMKQPYVGSEQMNAIPTIGEYSDYVTWVP